MAERSALQCLAIKAQSAAGTFTQPGNPADLIPAANLSFRPTPIQTENPEYQGSIHRPGPIVLGASYDVTFDLMLRGPGGASPPAADAFILGRALRSLGFTENIISTAIPVAAEALGGAGNTTAIAALGASAAATDDLYTGLAVHLAALGASMPAGLAMIYDYIGTGKLAYIAQTHTAAFSGNYQIPKQLAYTLAATGEPPVLSQSLWQGTTRYDFVDMAPSSGRIIFPTSSREGGNDYPRLSLTYSGDLQTTAEEAAPDITAMLALPPFKGGKLHIAGKPMGGSSLSLDLGTRVGFPPNPNKASGSDPAQLVETRRTLSMQLNKVAPSYLDIMGLAGAQSFHPIQVLYGLAAGNYVGFVATSARFNYPSNEGGGNFLTTNGEAYVDGASKTISLIFPYY